MWPYCKVAHDVKIEPKLLPVTGENFSNRTGNTHTWYQIKGVLGWGSTAFFDIRVFGPNAKRYLNSALPIVETPSPPWLLKGGGGVGPSKNWVRRGNNTEKGGVRTEMGGCLFFFYFTV